MKPPPGILPLLAASLACGALVFSSATAQTYPSKPIRLFVGFSPGAAPDVLARSIAPSLNELLGQPVIVENRGGAGGSIATAAVAKSPPDGYSLLMMAAADTLQPALRTNLTYDIERDLTPVAMIVTGMAVLCVHPSLPVSNVKDLIALARTNPGKLNYGSSGIGGSSHLMGELFNQLAQVKIAHVPYKGSADSAIATASGQIEISFPSVVAAGPFIDAKKLKALAVTGARRASRLPNLPTIAQAGLPGYERSTWFGVVAPGGVSKDIIARLHTAIGSAVATPEVRALLVKQGLDPLSMTPEQFGAFIHEQLAVNGKIVKLAGLKPR